MDDVVIGISSCIFPRDPQRPLFKGKVLLYGEESLCHWVLKAGVTAYMIPRATKPEEVARLVKGLDGLVLAGGTDVCPKSYQEDPLRPEWGGDPERDEYEIELFHEAMRQDRPVLGVCRGIQVLNVALGGSLYQDIGTQLEGSLVHRDWDIYDENRHMIDIEPSSILATIYKTSSVEVNSVHHQALKDLGKGLVVEAKSTKDGIIEAVRLPYSSPNDPYVAGVQWHPEWIRDPMLADPQAPLKHFCEAALEKRKRR